MSALTLIAEPYPSAAWKETVVRGVDQHNVAVTGLSDYYPVGFSTRMTMNFLPIRKRWTVMTPLRSFDETPEEVRECFTG